MSSIEIWKDINGYEGLYQISNYGRVKSLERTCPHSSGGVRTIKERILKYSLAGPKRRQYNIVVLCNDTDRKYAFVHILVAETFIRQKNKDMVIDHINNDQFDNRVENLRYVTIRENCSKDRKNKYSNYTGVSWHKRDKKWRATIIINGKQKSIGYYDNEDDAAKAYQKALKNIG